LLLDHYFGGLLQAVHSANQVNVHTFNPGVHIYLSNWRDGSRAAGVVEQYVDPSRNFDDFLKQILHLSWIGHVANNGVTIYVCSHGFNLFSSTASDHHNCAL
jgi:hypothetical protein